MIKGGNSKKIDCPWTHLMQDILVPNIAEIHSWCVQYH